MGKINLRLKYGPSYYCIATNFIYTPAVRTCRESDRSFLLCAARSKKTRSTPGYYVLQNVGMGRTLRTNDMMGNNTIVKFHIENLLNLNKRINAFVSLVPVDTNCSVTNLSIILFPKCKF